ncbi:MAG: phosphate signaling complex protein PhoU [Phycisphaerales bacterium]|nr:phosphate signaling complex protein PhoU [Phycisphaerales bacterium]
MTAHFVSLLEELTRRSLRMAAQVEDILAEACETIFDASEALALRVIRRDHEVDQAEVEVESEVIRLLALYQPVGVDLRLLCTILKVNNNLERVADCAVNVAERARHGQLQLVARESAELKQLCPVVRQALRDAVQAYAQDDAALARSVATQDNAIDALYGQIIRDVVAHPERTAANMAAYLDLLSVAKNLERIADHATNIAEDVIYLATGKIVRHQARGGDAPTRG